MNDIRLLENVFLLVISYLVFFFSFFLTRTCRREREVLHSAFLWVINVTKKGLESGQL